MGLLVGVENTKYTLSLCHFPLKGVRSQGVLFFRIFFLI